MTRGKSSEKSMGVRRHLRLLSWSETRRGKVCARFGGERKKACGPCWPLYLEDVANHRACRHPFATGKRNLPAGTRTWGAADHLAACTVHLQGTSGRRAQTHRCPRDSRRDAGWAPRPVAVSLRQPNQLAAPTSDQGGSALNWAASQVTVGSKLGAHRTQNRKIILRAPNFWPEHPSNKPRTKKSLSPHLPAVKSD